MIRRKVSLIVIFAFVVYGVVALADTLVMKDGTKRTGVFLGATSRLVTFKEDGVVHRYRLRSIQGLEFGSAGTRNAGSVADATKTTRQAVFIPAGTELAVRTNEDIDSKAATLLRYPGGNLVAEFLV